ncbi:DUF397 domain-containing protein [Streptomyces sp. NPDC127098]|uniref:DUF397 domain-containing protein n=1 Tax=Streptomyces sp. NPDC127098 TaxID=3347137 RepID=UPI003657338B
MIDSQSRHSASQLDWFKSSYSSSEGGDCVEVAAAPLTVHVRDSKIADGSRLAVPAAAWGAFLRELDN